MQDAESKFYISNEQLGATEYILSNKVYMYTYIYNVNICTYIHMYNSHV